MAVTYQPASRYWDLQWLETGIFLVLARPWRGLLLAGPPPGLTAGAVQLTIIPIVRGFGS